MTDRHRREGEVLPILCGKCVIGKSLQQLHFHVRLRGSKDFLSKYSDYKIIFHENALSSSRFRIICASKK